MFDLAQRLLTWNNNDRKDYSLKYEVLVDEQLANKSTQFTEENTIDSYKKICPRCKSELTLRIAKRGDNKGNQFFGCMNYPKCKYIENV